MPKRKRDGGLGDLLGDCEEELYRALVVSKGLQKKRMVKNARSLQRPKKADRAEASINVLKVRRPPEDS